MPGPAIARTRITVPRAPAAVLPRPRVAARLDAIRRTGIGAVVAGAGYGKTTTLAQWARDLDGPVAWYSVAEGDDRFRMLQHLSAALQLEEPAGDWHSVLDGIINALADAPGTVLVLDDAARLDAAALSYLLEYLPPQVAVLLLLRESPALPSWPGWVAQGRAEVLDADVLRLDETEIAALLEAHGQDPARAPRVLKESAGWPLAAGLLARSPERASVLHDVLERMLWDELAAPVRRVLEACSVLEFVSEAQAVKLSGNPEAGRLLADLHARGLLVEVHSDGRMRLHALLREFVLSRAADAKALHAAAAAVTEGEEAVLHHAAAGACDIAETALLARGPQWLQQGRQDVVLQLVEAIGPERPGLALLQAQALRQARRYDAALQVLRKAEALPGQELDALLGQARVYVDTLQPRHAVRILHRALRLGPQRPDVFELMAENCINEGRPKAALRYQRISQSCRKMPQLAAPDIRLLLRTGRLSAVRIAAGDSRPASRHGHRDMRLIVAYVAALEGDVAGVREAVQSVLDGKPDPTDELVAWSRLAHGLQLETKTQAEAMSQYRKALSRADALGVARMRAETLMGLSLLHAVRGETAASYEVASEGVTLTREAGDAWLAAWLLLTAAIAARLGGHPEATRHLADAHAALARCGDAFGRTVAELWQAPDEAAMQQRVREQGYGFLLERPTLFGPRHLAPTPEMPAWQVDTLGPLHISRNGVEIPSAAWKRRKALELFLLLLMRNGPMHREELMEQLFPDAGPKAAERDLRVMLHAMSDALEPERPPKQPTRLVERRQEALMLKPDLLLCDRTEFERLLDAARRAANPLPLWQRALALYQGDFLEEFPYLESAAMERERLRGLFLDAGQRLATRALAHGDLDEAVRVAHAILARDRACEEAWRVLLEVHRRNGQTWLISRTWEQCVKALEEELGVEPSEATAKAAGL
ncbi:MAG: BTAD domain-containing putative transcriptional regulator [Candidatus Xenobia bacterium]